MKTETVFAVIDFETTGSGPDDEVIELGWTIVDMDLNLERPGSTLIRCSREISIEAMAVHKITANDLIGKPTLHEAWKSVTEAAHGCPMILAAHRAEFEQQFLPIDLGAGCDWICTWKCAMRIFPDAPSFSNQALRFWLGHQMTENQRKYSDREHRAGPDAYVTAWTLRALLRQGADIEQLVRWSRLPALFPRLTFGKHKGSKWSEVPPDYLDWLITKSDMDDDVKWNARITLNGERAAMERESAFATKEEPTDDDTDDSYQRSASA